jgi:glucosyl-dolichyl phosphate glucuronosyltransferase
MTISPSTELHVSVIVATYNRCDVVRGAVESLMNQDSRGTRYEVIVVDNNSTDATRRTLEELSSKYDNLFYHFEERQGVSYARNRGIAAARAPILAFTDDDIKPASDWVAAISEGFRKFPDADCIGGKVLPQTAADFPVWLTSKHWTPLALLDMGDEPIILDVLNGPGLVAANLAVRAAVFKDVGLFQPELQRVKSFIGSLEDHEFELRLGAAKKRLMYLPELVVYAQVLDERLSKAYHRRWYRGHGYFYALMRNQNFEASKARLFDVPSHLYRRTCSNVVDWLRYRVKRNEELQLQQELELEFFWGFFRKRFADLFK